MKNKVVRAVAIPKSCMGSLNTTTQKSDWERMLQWYVVLSGLIYSFLVSHPDLNREKSPQGGASLSVSFMTSSPCLSNLLFILHIIKFSINLYAMFVLLTPAAYTQAWIVLFCLFLFIFVLNPTICTDKPGDIYWIIISEFVLNIF